MADDDQKAQSGNGISAGDVARLAPPVILIVLVVAFALANTQDTKVDLLFKETTAPLFLVLVATAVVGAIIGALLRRHRKNN